VWRRARAGALVSALFEAGDVDPTGAIARHVARYGAPPGSRIVSAPPSVAPHRAKPASATRAIAIGLAIGGLLSVPVLAVLSHLLP